MTWDRYNKSCPTRVVLDQIADKWTVLILELLCRRTFRFNALRREIDGLSQKVLSQTLKDMERNGLIRRRAFPTVPVTVEYSITPLGKRLAAVVVDLTRWVETNVAAILAAN